MASKIWASIALSAALLSGCGTSEAIMASASIATFVQTDHVVSLVYGEDCSVLYTEDGGDYCRDETYGQVDDKVVQQTYCYRTIGGIDCYVEEDPKASADQVIN